LFDLSAVSLNEFTGTGLAIAVREKPPTETVPLLAIVPAPVGVRFTVIVELCPPLITPRLHSTLLSVGVVGQVPPDADADTNVTGALPLPAARLSEKATFEVVSPVLVTVYVKLI
jgi:hypothetical protein